MPLAFRTVAGWLSTAQVLLRKGSGKQVFGELETLDQLELSLTDLSCLVTFGTNFEFVHLIVI